MIEPAALLAWSALALALTLTPGPDTLLVASHAARSGFKAGLAATAGIATGVVWYGALIAVGALSVIAAVPPLFMAVKIVGAIYLAWIGAGMLWHAFSSPARGGGVERSETEGVSPSEHVAGSPLSRGGAKAAFSQGFLTNALNPKVALFYLAALPQFTGSGANAVMIGMLLLAIHAAIGTVWLAFIAYAGSRARTIRWNPNVGRWLEGAVGAFFIGVAGRLAVAQR